MKNFHLALMISQVQYVRVSCWWHRIPYPVENSHTKNALETLFHRINGFQFTCLAFLLGFHASFISSPLCFSARFLYLFISSSPSHAQWIILPSLSITTWEVNISGDLFKVWLCTREYQWCLWGTNMDTPAMEITTVMGMTPPWTISSGGS